MRRLLELILLSLATSAFAYAPERALFSQFDAANRLTNTITPMGRTNVLVFNNRGLLQAAREPSGQWATNNYDARGRLTNRVDQAGVRTFRYDANNNCTNIVEGTRTNTWTFDAYDRVSTYRDADGNLIQYRYDLNGNLSNLIYPGNRTVTYLYDSLNRLTNVTDWVSRTTTITYDLANRVTSITRPNNTIRMINYDAAGETTNIIEKTTTGFPIAFFTLGWTNSGRVAWEFAGPLAHRYAPPYRSMGCNDDNQITSLNSTNTLGYDWDGNMTTGPLTNNALTTYGYDARNRLTNAAGVSYGYDPGGARASVTNGTNVVGFVVNPNAALPQVLVRTRLDGSETLYVYGVGLLYEVNLSSGGGELNTRTYHYDYRGSTVALTDGTGNITDRVEYSPYGLTTYRVGTNDTPFLYNGRYGVMTDPNGLLYMRARYYNPYLCRFINPDPAGFGGGLNWYCYADGNPVNQLDPLGLGAVGEGARLPSWLAGPACSYDLSAFSPDAQAAVQESFRRNASLAMQGLDFDPSIPQVPERSTATYLLTFGGLFLGGLASVEATAAAGTIPRVNVLPSSGNRFIVSPGGDAIIVPRGASGPVPVINQGGRTTGFGYTGGSGGLGLDPRVSNVRIMDATLPRGPSPGYPAGYVNYRNNALPTPQSVNPFTGQTLAPNDPFWHIPLTPP
jgi:RHS repeat-associated protein